LKFFSAAAHAVRVGRTNPAGLFATIVRKGLWSFVTSADEDIARGWLLEATAHAGEARVAKQTGPVRVGEIVTRLWPMAGFEMKTRAA
jgi:hypothetical protein